MEWAGWNDFWAMGGYGPYVWGSYGVTALALLIEIGVLRRSHRRTLERLKRLQRWEDAV